MNTQVLNIIKRSSMADEVLSNMKIKEDLGIDSLRIVELIVEIEETLDIEFEESDLDPSRLITVEDLISLVEKYK